jgi:hypothetical protein
MLAQCGGDRDSANQVSGKNSSDNNESNVPNAQTKSISVSGGAINVPSVTPNISLPWQVLNKDANFTASCDVVSGDECVFTGKLKIGTDKIYSLNGRYNDRSANFSLTAISTYVRYYINGVYDSAQEGNISQGSATIFGMYYNGSEWVIFDPIEMDGKEVSPIGEPTEPIENSVSSVPQNLHGEWLRCYGYLMCKKEVITDISNNSYDRSHTDWQLSAVNVFLDINNTDENSTIVVMNWSERGRPATREYVKANIINENGRLKIKHSINGAKSTIAEANASSNVFGQVSSYYVKAGDRNPNSYTTLQAYFPFFDFGSPSIASTSALPKPRYAIYFNRYDKRSDIRSYANLLSANGFVCAQQNNLNIICRKRSDHSYLVWSGTYDNGSSALEWSLEF